MDKQQLLQLRTKQLPFHNIVGILFLNTYKAHDNSLHELLLLCTNMTFYIILSHSSNMSS